MKRLITFALSLFTCIAAMAQNFTLSNDVYLAGPSTEFEHVGHAMIKNVQGSNQFTWKRVIVNTPSAWSNAICDQNSCWSVEVSSKKVIIEEGDSGLLDVHFYPASTSGNGTVALAVWVDDDSLSADTVYYNLNTWIARVPVVQKEEKLLVYPNPARTFVTLAYETDERLKVEIYDVLGKVQKTTYHQGKTSTIHIDELPAGLYIIRVYDNGRTYSKTFKKVL